MDFLQRVAKLELGDDVALAFASADDLPLWRWPRMSSYNGFTHEERVRGGQFIHWMIKTGRMPKAERCSISGWTENLQHHCEDYYRPWTACVISRPLHLALHRRFRQPDAWLTSCERYTRTGEEWFSSLPLTPIDIAGQLRYELR